MCRMAFYGYEVHEDGGAVPRALVSHSCSKQRKLSMMTILSYFPEASLAALTKYVEIGVCGAVVDDADTRASYRSPSRIIRIGTGQIKATQA